MAFKWDTEVAVISGGGVAVFGFVAWLLQRWKPRAEWARALAIAFMIFFGLLALLCGVCGVAIMADGGIRIQ